MYSAIYPRSSNDPNDNLVCKLLPQSNKNKIMTKDNDYLINSDVVDGTRVQGVGQTLDRSYRWRLIIESRVRSIAQVPDRFFDIQGRSYPIDWNSKVSVFNGEAPAYSNFKDAIIYKIGPAKEPNNLKPYIIFDAYTSDQDENSSSEIESFKQYLTKYSANLSPTTNPEALVSKTSSDDNAAYNIPEQNTKNPEKIKNCDYLAIVVDNNDNYFAFVGKKTPVSEGTTPSTKVVWYKPEEGVNVNQFKGLDMWIKFDSINELIYFLITKYEQDIISIQTSYQNYPSAPGKKYTITYQEEQAAEVTAISYKEPVIKENKSEDNPPVITYDLTYVDINHDTITIENLKNRPSVTSVDYPAKVNEDYTEINIYDKDSEERQNDGKLWCYINPRTMKPYLDDYWFHYKEPYYIKSLTIVDDNQQLDAKKITVKSDVWPGMYMMVGETYIRNRDTSEDEHMQIVIPQAKIKSEQTLTLQTDGEPTVFNLNMEVAQPKSKVLMEINTYKTRQKMIQEENGCFTPIDGSSEIIVM